VHGEEISMLRFADDGDYSIEYGRSYKYIEQHGKYCKEIQLEYECQEVCGNI
jgi:hypothetical protein